MRGGWRSGRRRLLLASACLLAIKARADAGFPSHALTLVVGFAPGGPNDILGRHLAVALAARLGRPVNVVNRAGESGNAATLSVVRAAPDGHTLLLMGPANAINASLFPHLAFDIRRDIVPVAGITREAMVMVVHPSLPVASVAGLLAHVRQGGRVAIAATGRGSAPHVAALLFERMSGLDLPVVQFDGGGPALADLMAGGRTQLLFEPLSAAIGPVRDGRLRALAVTGGTPVAGLAGVPVLADTLPGYDAGALTGIGVPRGTPRAVVERLNREVAAILADPEARMAFTDSGAEPLAGSPDDFARLFAGEIDKWAAVVKAAGLAAD